LAPAVGLEPTSFRV